MSRLMPSDLQSRLVKLEAIIFDFDGVICESVEAKTEAFRKLFQDYPEHLEKIIRFHAINGGINRYEKFKIIYRDFLKKELTDQESLRLGRQFKDYSYESVVNSAFVNGAYEFLQKYHKQFLLFIVSGTPQEEMISIVRERKLNQFFKGVYGSPSTKTELIKTILHKNKLAANQAIFVGDSINDYIGAQETGMKFIGRVHPNDSNLFQDVNLETRIADLKELAKWVEREQ